MSHKTTHGPAIRAIRTARGIQVQELAAAAGISGAYLTNIERGRKHPAMDTALRIAYELGVPAEAITVEHVCPTCDSTGEVA